MTVRSAADGLMRYWRGIDTSRGIGGGTREEASWSMQASSCMQFVLDNFEAVARSEVPCLPLYIYLFIYFVAVACSEVPCVYLFVFIYFFRGCGSH